MKVFVFIRVALLGLFFTPFLGGRTFPSDLYTKTSDNFQVLGPTNWLLSINFGSQKEAVDISLIDRPFDELRLIFITQLVFTNRKKLYFLRDGNLISANDLSRISKAQEVYFVSTHTTANTEKTKDDFAWIIKSNTGVKRHPFSGLAVICNFFDTILVNTKLVAVQVDWPTTRGLEVMEASFWPQSRKQHGLVTEQDLEKVLDKKNEIFRYARNLAFRRSPVIFCSLHVRESLNVKLNKIEIDPGAPTQAYHYSGVCDEDGNYISTPRLIGKGVNTVTPPYSIVTPDS